MFHVILHKVNTTAATMTLCVLSLQFWHWDIWHHWENKCYVEDGCMLSCITTRGKHKRIVIIWQQTGEEYLILEGMKRGMEGNM